MRRILTHTQMKIGTKSHLVSQSSRHQSPELHCRESCVRKRVISILHWMYTRIYSMNGHLCTDLGVSQRSTLLDDDFILCRALPSGQGKTKTRKEKHLHSGDGTLSRCNATSYRHQKHSWQIECLIVSLSGADHSVSLAHTHTHAITFTQRAHALSGANIHTVLDTLFELCDWKSYTHTNRDWLNRPPKSQYRILCVFCLFFFCRERKYEIECQYNGNDVNTRLCLWCRFCALKFRKLCERRTQNEMQYDEEEEEE